MEIKYKILIADDDLENLDILYRGLCDCYDIHPVSDGFAESAILPLSPDLIILEDKLPPSLIDPLIAKRRTPLPPIASSPIRPAADFSDYIARPFDPAEARRKIKRLIPRFESARAIAGERRAAGVPPR